MFQFPRRVGTPCRPRRATWGCTRVSQEAEGVRENVYKGLYSGFQGQGRVSRLRIGQFEEFQQAPGQRGCPLVGCIWSRVIKTGR